MPPVTVVVPDVSVIFTRLFVPLRDKSPVFDTLAFVTSFIVFVPVVVILYSTLLPVIAPCILVLFNVILASALFTVIKVVLPFISILLISNAVTLSNTKPL